MNSIKTYCLSSILVIFMSSVAFANDTPTNATIKFLNADSLTNFEYMGLLQITHRLPQPLIAVYNDSEDLGTLVNDSSKISFFIDDQSIAKVVDGEIVPLSQGTTTLNAVYQGCTTSTTIKITEVKPKEIRINGDSIEEITLYEGLNAGIETKLLISIIAENDIAYNAVGLKDSSFTFSIKDTKIADFTSSNINDDKFISISAKGIGETSGIFRYKGLEKELKIIVKAPDIIKYQLELNGDDFGGDKLPIQKNIKEYFKLVAQLNDNSFFELTTLAKWTSSDNNIVTIKDGELNGIKTGNAVITIEYKDFKQSIQTEIKIRNKIVIQLNNPYMKFNDTDVEIDPGRGTRAIMQDNRILVPIRTIIEKLGGSVEWDDKSKKTTVKLKDKTIILYINSNEVLINSVKQTIDVPAIINNSRTMSPLRFISENLGFTVEWNQRLNTVEVLE